MSETTTVGDEWLRLSDAVGATGLTERTLQRKATKGEILREDRGYGQVFYRIPASMRQDRLEEGAVVAVLREQGDRQVETIEAAATALERTTKALSERISTLEARETAAIARADAANRRADRRGLVAAFLSAAVVGLSATAWSLSRGLETEKATSRQMADSLGQVGRDLEVEKASGVTLRAKLDEAEKATTATEAERDALVATIASMGMVSGSDCEDGDKSATASPF